MNKFAIQKPLVFGVIITVMLLILANCCGLPAPVESIEITRIVTPPSTPLVESEFIARRSSISFGQTVTGHISDDNYEDKWDFEGISGDVISISMTKTSGNLDTYLELRNSTGQLLIENDDSGQTNNSLIESYTLPTTDTYTIVATRYLKRGGERSGDYELSLDH